MLKTTGYRLLALCSLALGLVGIPLPGLPTVPFVLLSAWAAGKGWPQFEEWLLAHHQFGPSIRQWRQQGAVSRRAKWLASGMMLASMLLLWLSTVPMVIKIIITGCLLLVAVWLWRRPQPQETADD
ncbi:hypothetical protein AAY72_08230 [Alishewanella sp. WH16-1]|uniref:YbaN family protein n=1 Tax=Alishewanella sp. WH16-1 TaxID=1651088 RepID=UPI00070A38D5|nr:YbaN family protein [Alishewanella sp. WH16-1]KRS21449.1 hypothetical protein AAY72_08230 [Alishewanella sp. WH16-1]